MNKSQRLRRLFPILGENSRVSSKVFTDQQEKALLLLAEGYNNKEVAKAVNVTDRSITRWKSDPEFRTELDRLTAQTGLAVEMEQVRMIKRVIRDRIKLSSTPALLSKLDTMELFEMLSAKISRVKTGALTQLLQALSAGEDQNDADQVDQAIRQLEPISAEQVEPMDLDGNQISPATMADPDDLDPITLNEQIALDRQELNPEELTLIIDQEPGYSAPFPRDQIPVETKTRDQPRKQSREEVIKRAQEKRPAVFIRDNKP